MRVLVSGGAGYIGSVTVLELVERNDEVVVIDNLSQGHLKAVDRRAIFRQGDLNNKEFLETVFQDHKPEAVLHFASRSQVGQSMQSPFLYLANNALEGLNLIDCAVKHGVQRFILSSTANLYGNPQSIPITENEQIAPGSPYGEAKLYLEKVLAWTEKISGLKYGILRYFNAAGATENLGEDHDPETHLIPLVLQVALKQRESISVFGDNYATDDGTCIRDYIHVSDLAQAHILTLDAIVNGSKVYNLGNGKGYSVLDVIKSVERMTGQKIPYQIAAPRAGDVAILVAGSKKIQRELHWQPRFTDLDSIVASAWSWHRAHPYGYEEA